MSSTIRPPHLRPKRPRSVLGQWWLDLPIRAKGLLVVALPVIMLAATVAIRLPFNQQQQHTSDLLARAASTRDMTQELLMSLLDIDTGVRGYVLTRDQLYLARVHNARLTVPPRLARLGAVVMPAGQHQVFDAAAHEARRVLDIADEIVTRVDNGASPTDAAVRDLLERCKAAMESMRVAMGAMRRHQDALVAESEAELERLRQRLTPVMFVTLIGGLVGALAAAWLFATGIASRIRALELNAERLARGGRLKFANSRGGDEIGSLDRALRRASLLLRRRERELRSVNAELERTVHEQTLLNRELEAFSYSVSHDLRAPLRSIDGFAQALREDWGDRLDETGQDHLARVRNAAQRMGRLIDDLLKLSRLTRAQMQRSEVDLSAMAREIISELEDRNPTRNVVWLIDDHLHASCDPGMARIVLENLLGNAWKFTSKTDGARIEFRALDQSHPRVFVIRDNGAGFDMRYADKLFAPFQRLHGEREFPGTGIGLATVQRIVRKHGGDVRTRAELGRGAAFYFSFGPTDGVAAA